MGDFNDLRQLIKKMMPTFVFLLRHSPRRCPRAVSPVQ